MIGAFSFRDEGRGNRIGAPVDNVLKYKYIFLDKPLWIVLMALFFPISIANLGIDVKINKQRFLRSLLTLCF
jgi:hypothetical protein